MKLDTWKTIDDSYQREFDRFGSNCARAADVPTEVEVVQAMHLLGTNFDSDYREFLLRYGSGHVGAFPIYGLRPAPAMGRSWSVIEQTKRFRAEGWPPEDWYVISNDGYGNPIAMSPQGEVYINEYDFGGETKIYDTFEEFLVDFCLREYDE